MKHKTSYFLIFFLIFSVIFSSVINVKAYEDNSKKVIYLTFDDGPGGKVTKKILDILKEEKVPATFFLIGNQIKDQEDILIRMSDEGHSLGLHSMTHEKCNLYNSSDNFIKEMLTCQKLIEDVTGVAPNILRFPFGCNNNTYKLKEELVNKIHENNLKIYDWNVDSTDGANPSAPPDTFIKNSKSDKDTIILLMHCGFQSKNSAKALPSIIKYYKDKGYTFKKIDSNTEEIFHYMK